MIKNAKILVVEDEADFARLFQQRFKKQIRNQTYAFTYVGNGVDALEELGRNEGYDLILSDINMPVMDGITLLSELKDTDIGLKIIMITAYSDMQNIRKAMNLGAFDFITKPINFVDLEITIEKALREVETARRATRVKELEITNARLGALGRMKSQFFTNISHEFRTPITIITGVVDQIREKPEQWLNRGVNMIKRNSDNLLYLVDQILDLARLEENKLQLRMVRGDVIDYLYKVAEPFRLLAESKNVRLKVNKITPELIMDYDPDQLSKVLSNLLSNAIKFNKPGGTVTITLDVRPFELSDGDAVKTLKADNCLMVIVEDSGWGIPNEKLSFIFERFYQIDGSSTRQVGGTGIGLPIVRELTRLMGGKITVSSEEGKGTVFTVAIPVDRQSLTPSQGRKKNMGAEEFNTAMASAYLGKQNSLDSVLGIDLKHSSILVIGDKVESDERLRIYLEDRYELMITKDVDEGILLARKEIPDVIIFNIGFHDVNMYELCKSLKTDERTNHIPVLLLADKADLQANGRGKNSGV